MGIKDTLPRRVVVSRVLTGRYAPGSRPVSWDDRKEGVESVLTVDGQTLRLYSNGGQSTPSVNWELLLTNEQADVSGAIFSWTLYGIASNTSSDLS
jgi:hypothetical protein